MTLADLVGQRVTFGVSEPWEFASQQGEGPFSASVRASSTDAVLLKLTKPMRYRETDFDHLVASARHTDKNISELTIDVAIPVNLTPIRLGSVEESNTEAFFKAAAAWRQWHLVGGLRLEKPH